MMNETFEERIGKYLSGESSASEREALEHQINNDSSLREDFLAIQRIWVLNQTTERADWNVDKAWQKFSVSNQTTQPVVIKNTRIKTLGWAVAAVLVLAIGLSTFLWYGNSPVEYAFDENSSGPLQLEDGSAIFLNEGSSLKVWSFNKNKRVVELTGEAFFEISHDPKKPFLVKAGNTVTEVVGTSFNIDQSKNQISIFVKTGKVIFRSQQNETIEVALTSGEAAIFENDKIKPVVNPSPNIHSWQSKELHFKGMPLSEVIADIEAYFGKKISIENEQVKKCRVTFTQPFKAPEFDAVVESIALAVNASVFVDDSKCILKGGNKNCVIDQ